MIRTAPRAYLPRAKDRPPAKWRMSAPCAKALKHQMDWWYPELRDNWWKIAAARRICAECPFRALCEELAWANDEKYGIWGGVNFGNRDEKRRRRASISWRAGA